MIFPARESKEGRSGHRASLAVAASVGCLLAGVNLRCGGGTAASSDGATTGMGGVTTDGSTGTGGDVATGDGDAGGEIGGQGASAGAAGGTAGATGAGGRPAKTGNVTLLQSADPTGSIRDFLATASFHLPSDSPSLTDLCTVTNLGACSLFEACAPYTQGPAPRNVLAGSIVISGLAQNVSLSEGGAGYYSNSSAVPLWTTSQLATVVATGSADVPAFSLSLQVPNPIKVSTPLLHAGSTYTISRKSDLKVTWTGGVEGYVNVRITGQGSPGTAPEIRCGVAASAATLSVPAALMSRLGTNGDFAASVVTWKQMDQNGWAFNLQASISNDPVNVTFTAD